MVRYSTSSLWQVRPSCERDREGEEAGLEICRRRLDLLDGMDPNVTALPAQEARIYGNDAPNINDGSTADGDK